ncbi:TenA family protein [Gluconacetobacter takamatsuzukensis]|uniref:TenA family protein n=1 Tax=Gluconacetobacter takamatsuzukensis TaxID=1286190 RepID=A0A7W4KCR7_9PROT|nr:TenA family protein [Gluconacetobacter takamatsuzukensis]MBB2204450.1 TenA family protein [Gluconacetobacter takamatsuzukensis]
MSWIVERDWPRLEQGLAGRLRRDCGADWERFIHHPFVRGMADGTLPEADFQRFLIQDYLYLIQYARAYALAIYKADTMEGMRSASAIVSGLLDTELALHIAYCAGWGLCVEDLHGQPESLELLAYTRFILDRGQTGDLLDLIVTLAPCLIGYGEIGARLMADPATRREGNPYWDWIALYGGEKFIGLVEAGLDTLESLAGRYGAEGRYPALLSEFRTAVKLEAAFWYAGRSGML